MKEFPSLREFMLLTDYQGRSVWEGRCLTPAEMVSRYDIAKKSWQTYGEGPPIGSRVATLFAGHGGPAGMLKMLAGFYGEGYDRRFYRLIDPYDCHSSVSDVDHWWTEFMVVETPK